MIIISSKSVPEFNTHYPYFEGSQGQGYSQLAAARTKLICTDYGQSIMVASV
jgi:hypothetical protein